MGTLSTVVPAVIGARSSSSNPQVVQVTKTVSQSAADAASDNAQADAAEERRQNLLRRDRGVLGTVQTSLRGLLGSNENTPARKSLLGE